MISQGPIIFHMLYRQCTGMGPLTYTEAAADYFAWAHYFYMVHSQCTRMGPLENIKAADDDFVWVHYFSYGVPPM